MSAIPRNGHRSRHSIISSARARNDFRDRQPERLGAREIDDELELGRLLDRDIAGLRAMRRQRCSRHFASERVAIL